VWIAFTFALVVALFWGCGAKQKISEPKAPKPFLPGTGTCPGALPGENIQVTVAMGESNFPEVTWTGKRFDITWWDLRTPSPSVYTVGMNREGYEVSPLVRLSGEGSAKQHSLVSDGKETHVVWKEEAQIYSIRLNGGDSEPRLLAVTGSDPAAGPWGSAAFVDEGLLYFRCDGMIDLDTGAPLDPVPVASGGIENPRIAYNGIYFAIVWSESSVGGRNIVMQRVSPKGEKLGSQVKVSAVAGQSRKPNIAWANKNFAIAWTNAAPDTQNPRDRYRIFFAVVPEVGDRPISTRQLKFAGSADQVAVAATGEEYGLAWVGSKKNGGSAIYLQRIDLKGEPVEETIEVTDGIPFVCSNPSITWDGQGYGVVWHDDRGQVDTEIYMSYVACGEEVKKSAAPSKTPSAEKPVEEAPETTDGLPGLKEAF
jgi:hypothetical protein